MRYKGRLEMPDKGAKAFVNRRKKISKIFEINPKKTAAI